MKSIQVKQIENKEVPVDVIAESIVSISEGIKKLKNTRLSDDALYLLIQNAAPTARAGRGYTYQKISIKDIKAVFEGIELLEKKYLKKTK